MPSISSCIDKQIWKYSYYTGLSPFFLILQKNTAHILLCIPFHHLVILLVCLFQFGSISYRCLHTSIEKEISICFFMGAYYSTVQVWPLLIQACLFSAFCCYTQWCTSMAIVVYSLSYIQLFCDPMNCSSPGSSIYGISQARILEWVAISLSRASSQPRGQTRISCIGRWILYPWATRGAHKYEYQFSSVAMSTVAVG